jgi:hypothetical protein
MRLLHREPDADRPDEQDAAVEKRTDADAGERTSVFHRWTHRDDTPATTTTEESARTVEREPDAPPAVVTRRRVRREYAHRPFHFGNALAIAFGAVLAVIGIVALARGDLDQSWDRPVTTVLDIDHTPLIAALEIGAGVLVVLLALSGRRFLALIGTVAVTVAAAAVAVEPGRLATQYALEQWWAWAVAGGAAFCTLVLLLPSGRRKVRVEEPATTTTAA